MLKAVKASAVDEVHIFDNPRLLLSMLKAVNASATT
jgi:hypothetical protein